ncbi:MAG: DUF262 domain-containing protein [Planctomycetes bacterium]|nr:DUF262 domain-containing protein [Planctomycetota bacterium]
MRKLLATYLEINLPKPDYPVNYLLDGQQRLSTICGALYWNGPDPNSMWNIAYDLRNRAFVHLDTLGDPPQHQVRMNKLSDGAVFYKYYATLDSLTAPDRDVLKVNADSLFNRFKDYKVAVVTLGDMSIRDVAPIFERINSTGTRLTIVDLMRAATWSQEFDLIDAIDSVRDALSAKEFGGLDRKVVLRTMSAAAGGGFSVESIDSLRKHSAEVLKRATADSQAAYEKTVDFLVTQIRIPSDSVIPYANQVVVLSEIFRLLPTPTAAQYAEIRKWFWRTASGGYFSGWNTGEMARDQAAVAAFVAGTASEIKVPAYKPNAAIWIDKPFRTDSAHAKTLAIILAHHSPHDILTGQYIDVTKSLAWTNSKEYHHLFPRDYLKGLGVDANRANCLANIIMLSSVSNKRVSNRAPSDYLKETQSMAGDNLEEWLASNLISEAAFDAALKDDYSSFLTARSQTISEVISELGSW